MSVSDVYICLLANDVNTDEVQSMLYEMFSNSEFTVTVKKGNYHGAEDDFAGIPATFKVFALKYIKHSEELNRILTQVRKSRYYEVFTVSKGKPAITDRDVITESNPNFWHLKPEVSCQYVFTEE